MPFARPPVGPLRFRPPLPPEPWAGVRPAIEYGPAAPQPLDEILAGTFGHPPFVTDEGSCLTLNVWTPATGAGSRPVLVWLHGGAFGTGSGSDLVFDSARLLSGTWSSTTGWSPSGSSTSANLGLLDQVAALGWVCDTIAAFGGDPGSVTVFGQSAGAMSTACLMTMPAARGLFGKAIMQSGSGRRRRSPHEPRR